MMWRAMPAGIPDVHQAIARLAALPPSPVSAATEAAVPSAKEAGLETSKAGKVSKLAMDVDAETAHVETAKGSVSAASGGEMEHVLSHFFASRTIRRLLQSPPPPEGLDVQPFAAVLWEEALAGRCHLWADGHRYVYMCITGHSTCGQMGIGTCTCASLALPEVQLVCNAMSWVYCDLVLQLKQSSDAL